MPEPTTLMTAASILDSAKPTSPITSSAGSRSRTITDFKTGAFINSGGSSSLLMGFAAIAGIMLLFNAFKK